MLACFVKCGSCSERWSASLRRLVFRYPTAKALRTHGRRRFGRDTTANLNRPRRSKQKRGILPYPLWPPVPPSSRCGGKCRLSLRARAQPRPSRWERSPRTTTSSVTTGLDAGRPQPRGGSIATASPWCAASRASPSAARCWRAWTRSSRRGIRRRRRRSSGPTRVRAPRRARTTTSSPRPTRCASFSSRAR